MSAKVSLAEVYPKALEVRLGYNMAPASVRFNTNFRALAEAMFEMMDQLGGEGSG